MYNEQKMIEILSKTYDGAAPVLKFSGTFQLLVSVILSAQCTDEKVNKVTAVLFRDYPDAKAMDSMETELLEEYIKSCGLYKNKAKNIKATAEIIANEYGGRVPDTREELMKLPGVGRKTANVVLSVGFGKPAIAVDTHVFRVANRTGLAKANTPDGVEEQLCRKIPEEKWAEAHHWLIFHGRRVCHSQKPACGTCPLAEYCVYYSEKENK